MPFSNWVHLEVEEILVETDKAFKVQIGGDDYWIPKSQIADWEDYEANDCDITLSVTEYIANQLGLEGD